MFSAMTKRMRGSPMLPCHGVSPMALVVTVVSNVLHASHTRSPRRECLTSPSRMILTSMGPLLETTARTEVPGVLVASQERVSLRSELEVTAETEGSGMSSHAIKVVDGRGTTGDAVGHKQHSQLKCLLVLSCISP